MIKQVHELSDICPGDLLITEDSRGKKVAYTCKEILNPGTGRSEILLTDDGSNKYFIWGMFKSGESWVEKLWRVKNCSIHENATKSGQ